jgi:hypothetical protein
MNDELEQKLQQQLRASEDELDGPTLARLHAARNRALEKAGGRRVLYGPQGWLAAAAAASVAASVAAIALFVALRQPADDMPASVAAFESTLMAAADSDELANPAGAESVDTGTDTAETLDLLENLEFYEWLSEQDTQEQQS